MKSKTDPVSVRAALLTKSVPPKRVSPLMALRFIAMCANNLLGQRRQPLDHVEVIPLEPLSDIEGGLEDDDLASEVQGYLYDQTLPPRNAVS